MAKINRERLNFLILDEYESNRNTRTILESVPDGCEEKHWPIQYNDLLENPNKESHSDKWSVDITHKNETQIEISARAFIEEPGVELQRRNMTGGDYADLRQEISITGEIQLSKTEHDEYEIDESGTYIEFHCEITATNMRSHQGETPPF